MKSLDRAALGPLSSEAVYLAKGIAIILVVVGHYQVDLEPLYWTQVRTLIYKFHMPLFFVLSGYLFAATGKRRSFVRLCKEKIGRLIIPFCSVAGILLIAKYSSGKFVRLDYPVSTASVVKLVVNPMDSYAPTLWFAYTLFLIFMIFPWIQVLLKRSPFVFLLALSAMYPPWPAIFCLKYVFLNMPYFAFGAVLGQTVDVERVGTKEKALALALTGYSVAFLFIRLTVGTLAASRAVTVSVNFAFGLLGSFVILMASQLLAKTNVPILRTVLLPIGYYSMGIYLLHPLFESPIRILFYQVFKGSSEFFLVAILAISSGIGWPILLEKYVLRKFETTRKYLLGLGTN
jgi:fucose 4-O-acetylase-like acetyltransferase